MNREQGNFTLPDFNIEKTVEAVGYLLQLHGIGKSVKFLKIIKLLYLADRKALEEWERPITNDVYVSMPMGQVLSTTYNLIKGELSDDAWDEYIERNSKNNIKLKKQIKLKKLSPAEVELLEKIFAEYGNYSAFDLAELTHKLPEYVNPGNSSVVTPLWKLLQALGYKNDEVNRILNEMQSEAEIDILLGV